MCSFRIQVGERKALWNKSSIFPFPFAVSAIWVTALILAGFFLSNCWIHLYVTQSQLTSSKEQVLVQNLRNLVSVSVVALLLGVFVLCFIGEAGRVPSFLIPMFLVLAVYYTLCTWLLGRRFFAMLKSVHSDVATGSVMSTNNGCVAQKSACGVAKLQRRLKSFVIRYNVATLCFVASGVAYSLMSPTHQGTGIHFFFPFNACDSKLILCACLVVHNIGFFRWVHRCRERDQSVHGACKRDIPSVKITVAYCCHSIPCYSYQRWSYSILFISTASLSLSTRVHASPPCRPIMRLKSMLSKVWNLCRKIKWPKKSPTTS